MRSWILGLAVAAGAFGFLAAPEAKAQQLPPVMVSGNRLGGFGTLNVTAFPLPTGLVSAFSPTPFMFNNTLGQTQPFSVPLGTTVVVNGGPRTITVFPPAMGTGGVPFSIPLGTTAVFHHGPRSAAFNASWGNSVPASFLMK